MAGVRQPSGTGPSAATSSEGVRGRDFCPPLLMARLLCSTGIRRKQQNFADGREAKNVKKDVNAGCKRRAYTPGVERRLYA